MTTAIEPQDPPKDEPDEQGRTGDGAVEKDAAPESPEPDPEPEPEDDVIAVKAENARLAARNAELEAAEAARKKAPAPPKKAEKPKEPEPPRKKKRRTSRFLGDHYYDED
jgi:hypothetical protein